MLADDVGVDFPDLVVILAHGGRPLWMNEAFFLVRRHQNMYMDISGIPPQKLMEYFPRIEEIADKVSIRHGLARPRAFPASAATSKNFALCRFRRAAQQKILYDNAARLFPRRLRRTRSWK